MSIDLIELESAGAVALDEVPVGADRRRAPRFSAVEARIWLGWWDGEEFQTIGSRLLDVSRTGVAISCPDGPDPGEDAWFCVVGPRLSGGTRARVVGREPMPDDPTAIRLRLVFLPRCPDDVFEIALGLLPSGAAVPLFD